MNIETRIEHKEFQIYETKVGELSAYFYILKDSDYIRVSGTIFFSDLDKLVSECIKDDLQTCEKQQLDPINSELITCFNKETIKFDLAEYLI